MLACFSAMLRIETWLRELLEWCWDQNLVIPKKRNEIEVSGGAGAVYIMWCPTLISDVLVSSLSNIHFPEA